MPGLQADAGSADVAGYRSPAVTVGVPIAADVLDYGTQPRIGLGRVAGANQRIDVPFAPLQVAAQQLHADEAGGAG